MFESDKLQIRRVELEGEVKWITELVESQQYKNLIAHLRVRLMTLRAQLMTTDLANTEAAFYAARLRGQIVELETYMTLPELMLQNLEQDLSQVYAEQRAETEAKSGEA